MYPSDVISSEEIALLQYDNHVCWFQELVFRYQTVVLDFAYCFTPHELYSNLAWKVIVADLKFAVLDFSLLTVQYLIDLKE